jgi:SSS family solute:Na+ symporter
MLATVMSTTDGLTFIAALTLGRDVFSQLTGRRDDRSVNRYTQAGVVITAVVSIASVLLFPSVIELWYVLGTLFIPAMLLPIVAVYYPRLRIPPAWTFAAMLLGFLVSFFSFLWGQLHASAAGPQYFLGLEPMYAGMAVTVLLYATGPKRS